MIALRNAIGTVLLLLVPLLMFTIAMGGTPVYVHALQHLCWQFAHWKRLLFGVAFRTLQVATMNSCAPDIAQAVLLIVPYLLQVSNQQHRRSRTPPKARQWVRQTPRMLDPSTPLPQLHGIMVWSTAMGLTGVLPWLKALGAKAGASTVVPS